MQTTIPLKRQLACARRELALRRKAYPGWVQRNKMTHAEAEEEIAAMEGIIATLLADLEREAQAGQMALFGTGA